MKDVTHDVPLLSRTPFRCLPICSQAPTRRHLVESSLKREPSKGVLAPSKYLLPGCTVNVGGLRVRLKHFAPHQTGARQMLRACCAWCAMHGVLCFSRAGGKDERLANWTARPS